MACATNPEDNNLLIDFKIASKIQECEAMGIVLCTCKNPNKMDLSREAIFQQLDKNEEWYIPPGYHIVSTATILFQEDPDDEKEKCLMRISKRDDVEMNNRDHLQRRLFKVMTELGKILKFEEQASGSEEEADYAEINIRYMASAPPLSLYHELDNPTIEQETQAEDEIASLQKNGRTAAQTIKKPSSQPIQIAW